MRCFSRIIYTFAGAFFNMLTLPKERMPLPVMLGTNRTHIIFDAATEIATHPFFVILEGFLLSNARVWI